MVYSYDPEVAAVLAQRSDAPVAEPPERGDWLTLRRNTEELMAVLANATLPVPGVSTTRFFADAPDGASLELRWYAKDGVDAGSAVVYAHGGGLVCGTLDLYDTIVSRYVASSGVPMLAVEYRRAPEAHGTSLSEDVFAAVLWLRDHADELGVDAERIAVMGDSGGGAPTAGAALLARDRGIVLARQILIYPMLDDRNTEPDPYLAPFATWTYDNNYTGWSALLGDEIGGESVSPIAAPSRAADFRDLAPAYLDVGELDIFRDETLDYASRLSKAGVSVELHVHPGAPHAFDGFAPQAGVSERVLADRDRVLRSL